MEKPKVKKSKPVEVEKPQSSNGEKNEKGKKGIFLTLQLIGIIIPIFVAAISSIFYLGGYLSEIRCEKKSQDFERIIKEGEQSADSLKIKIDSLKNALEKCKNPDLVNYNVFNFGGFGDNMHLGVNTSGNKTNWVTVSGGEITMNYPAGENWGAVFITVGKATEQREDRKFEDFSRYSTLVLELFGKKGNIVKIGMKDTQSPEVGTRYTLNLEEGWQTYKIDLDVFKTADRKNLYVVTEFIFDNNPQTLRARKIQFE